MNTKETKNISAVSPLVEYKNFCKQGKLAYQFFPDSGSVIFHPRILDPKSGSDNFEWKFSKGLGTVYASTTVHRKKDHIYNVSLIDVDEGFRMMSRIEDIESDLVKPGMRVRMRMATNEAGESYPVFIPLEEAGK